MAHKAESMRPIVLAAIAIVAATPAAAQNKVKTCKLPPPDSAMTRHAAVYRDCEVDRSAVPLVTLQPDFTPARDGQRAPVCFFSIIDAVVDTSGFVEQRNVRKVKGNSVELGDAMIVALGALRYTPAVRAGKPVRQLVRYEYSIGVSTINSQVVRRPGLPDSRPPGCNWK